MNSTIVVLSRWIACDRLHGLRQAVAARSLNNGTPGNLQHNAHQGGVCFSFLKSGPNIAEGLKIIAIENSFSRFHT